MSTGSLRSPGLAGKRYLIPVDRPARARSPRTSGQIAVCHGPGGPAWTRLEPKNGLRLLAWTHFPRLVRWRGTDRSPQPDTGDQGRQSPRRRTQGASSGGTSERRRPGSRIAQHRCERVGSPPPSGDTRTYANRGPAGGAGPSSGRVDERYRLPLDCSYPLLGHCVPGWSEKTCRSLPIG